MMIQKIHLYLHTVPPLVLRFPLWKSLANIRLTKLIMCLFVRYPNPTHSRLTLSFFPWKWIKSYLAIYIIERIFMFYKLKRKVLILHCVELLPYHILCTELMRKFAVENREWCFLRNSVKKFKTSMYNNSILYFYIKNHLYKALH